MCLKSLWVFFILLDVTDFLLYLLKTSENQRFSNEFRVYRKRPVARDELTLIETDLWDKVFKNGPSTPSNFLKAVFHRFFGPFLNTLFHIFHGRGSRNVFKINHIFNCVSKFFIHLMSFKLYEKQYIVGTANYFRNRWNGYQDNSRKSDNREPLYTKPVTSIFPL